MVASAVVTALVGIVIWIVARDDPGERGYASYFPGEEHEGDIASIAAHLREVLRYRNTWLILIIPGAFSGILLTFAGLWGVPFLVSQHGFTTREAATMASAMLITWALGGLAYGRVSERLASRKAPMVAGLVVTLALWSVVVFTRALPRAALVALLLCVALAAGAFILSFAFAKESVPPRLGGTVSGIANMGVMLGAMLMQPLVGFMLDRHWNGRIEGGVRAYDFAAYQWGFALMLAWGILSLGLLAFARETHCRQLR
jgi:MFS family permease